LRMCPTFWISARGSSSWAQPYRLALELDGQRRKQALVKIIGERWQSELSCQLWIMAHQDHSHQATVRTLTVCQILFLRGGLVTISPAIGTSFRLGTCLEFQTAVQCLALGQALQGKAFDSGLCGGCAPHEFLVRWAQEKAVSVDVVV
jgi:hypothetical protein